MNVMQRIERACERVAERNGWTWAAVPLAAEASLLVVCFSDKAYYCLIFLTPEDIAPVKDDSAGLEAPIEGMVPAEREPGGWSAPDLPATLH